MESAGKKGTSTLLQISAFGFMELQWHKISFRFYGSNRGEAYLRMRLNQVIRDPKDTIV
ncbi:hypothetical protein KY289_001180 [Solanum tuberosum]|nr:hypothetical protein KY289_001180 [Solanum tuberosum]